MVHKVFARVEVAALADARAPSSPIYVRLLDGGPHRWSREATRCNCSSVCGAAVEARGGPEAARVPLLGRSADRGAARSTPRAGRLALPAVRAAVGAWTPRYPAVPGPAGVCVGERPPGWLRRGDSPGGAWRWAGGPLKLRARGLGSACCGGTSPCALTALGRALCIYCGRSAPSAVALQRHRCVPAGRWPVGPRCARA